MQPLVEISEKYSQRQTLGKLGELTLVEAVDRGTEEVVVLEMLPATDDERAERFVAKVEELVTLRHSCLPAILGGGVARDGRLFLAREWLGGRAFETLDGEAPAQITSLLLQVIGGLDLLGEHRLAHTALSDDTLKVVPDLAGARSKMTALATGVWRSVAEESDFESLRQEDVRALGGVAGRLFGATIRQNGSATPRVELPLAVSFELEDAEALRQLLERCLQAGPETPPISYPEISDTLFRCLWGRGAGAGDGAGPAARLTFSTEPQDEFLQHTPTGEETAAGTHAVAEITKVVLPDDDQIWTPHRDPDDTAAVDEEESSTRPGVDTVEPTRPGLDGAEATRAAVGEDTRPGLADDRERPSEGPSQVLVDLGDVDTLDEMLAPVSFVPGEEPAEERELPPLPDPLPPVELTTQPVPSPPPATEEESPPPTKASRKGLWLALAALLAVTLAAGALWVVIAFVSRPAPPVVVEEAPPPPPPQVLPEPVEAAPVEPQDERLLEVRRLLSEGEDGAARELLGAFSEDDLAALPAADCELHNFLGEVLVRLDQQRYATDLEDAFRQGSLTRLRNAVAAVEPTERDFLERYPGAGEALERARRISATYTRAQRASRDGDSEEVLRTTDTLRGIFPAYAGTESLRESAAAAIEDEADVYFDQGRYEQAIARLELLRGMWSDREGLRQRLELIRTRQRAERDLESLLDTAALAADEGRPDEGLALLSGVQAPRPLRGRLTELRRRLRNSLAELDAQSPSLELRSGSGPEFAKDESAFLIIAVRDDFRVEDVTVFARVGEGAFQTLPFRRDGDEYTVEVTPDFHANQTVEYYATARDVSGNEGTLGSAAEPFELKRKRWFHRLRPNS